MKKMPFNVIILKRGSITKEDKKQIDQMEAILETFFKEVSYTSTHSITAMLFDCLIRKRRERGQWVK